MQAPSQELEDVAAAFAAITFKSGLKDSKKAEFANLSSTLEKKADRAKAILVRANPSFGDVPSTNFQNVCVDASIVSRPEFTVACAANKSLAYVGDAYLTLYLAKRSFKARRSPQQNQEKREASCSHPNLAKHYDALFGAEDIVLQWSGDGAATSTLRQKAELFVSSWKGRIDRLTFCV